MKEATAKLLGKSARAIETARKTLAIPDTETAIARAYYAMFYTSEALLFERGLTFGKHSGVHAAFGQHFAKPGLLDAKYHQWLLNAFERRIIADYGVDEAILAEEAIEAIERASEFLVAARRYLEGAP